jgi:hypothetical protein
VGVASGRRRIRWWWFVVAAVVLAAGAFFGVRYFLYRDTTTTLSPEEVLARFRASTTTLAPTTSSPPTTAPSIRLPDPGVYRYATTGQEHVDALGGTTHDYPVVTTVTVTPTGCGVQVRWDALEERWSSRQLCAGPAGITAYTDTTFHRFYGQDDVTDATCSPPFVFLPAAPSPGASWSATCVDGDDHEAITLTVVGIEDVVVAGQAVKAAHITWAEIDHSSDQDGTITTDRWLALDNGLLLRETSTTTSTTSTVIGDVHYREQYELTLTSLTPST